MSHMLQPPPPLTHTGTVYIKRFLPTTHQDFLQLFVQSADRAVQSNPIAEGGESLTPPCPSPSLWSRFCQVLQPRRNPPQPDPCGACSLVRQRQLSGELWQHNAGAINQQAGDGRHSITDCAVRPKPHTKHMHPHTPTHTQSNAEQEL